MPLWHIIMPLCHHTSVMTSKVLLLQLTSVVRPKKDYKNVDSYLPDSCFLVASRSVPYVIVDIQVASLSQPA